MNTMTGGAPGQVPGQVPGPFPGQVPEQVPGQVPEQVPVPIEDPTQGQPPTQWPPPTEPQEPLPPTKPGEPTDPTPPDESDASWLKPVLIGAGVLGAAALGAHAVLDGARNVRALQATANAFESGAMHQGGLQAVRDAGLGARFADGIGLADHLAVATPVFNRIGETGRLTATARGHLDHAELLASATALRRGVDDAVHVDPAAQASVLGTLESGGSLGEALAASSRSASGARPALKDEQLLRYWNGTSIIERGPRGGGRHVMSSITEQRPELKLDNREILETGRTDRINQLVAGRGARLDRGRGLAEGVGHTQGLNVSILNPQMRQHAMLMSRVDPFVAERLGLPNAFTQRWVQRLGTE